MSALYESVADIFVCVPCNYACMCMKPPCMLFEGRSCRTALGVGLATTGKHAGRGYGGYLFIQSDPIHFHSFLPCLNPPAPLVNYGGWTEEIRAWVWKSQRPAPFLW